MAKLMTVGAGPAPGINGVIALARWADAGVNVRCRPALELLETRDNPSGVGALAGDLLFTPTAPDLGPAAVGHFTPGHTAALRGDRFAALFRSDDDAAMLGSIGLGAGLLAGVAGDHNVRLPSFHGRAGRGGFTRTEEAFGPAVEARISGEPMDVDAPEPVAAGTDNVYAAAGLTAAAALLVYLLRQHPGRADGDFTPKPRTEPKPKRADETEGEAEWPGLAALWADVREEPPVARREPEATAPTAEGCPYVAELRKYVDGCLAADTDEGRRVEGHRECPRCRRWLDFFQREADSAAR